MDWGEKQPRQRTPCERTLCEAQAYGKHLLSQRTDEHECANVRRALRYTPPAIQRHVGLLLFVTFSFKKRKS